MLGREEGAEDEVSGTEQNGTKYCHWNNKSAAKICAGKRIVKTKPTSKKKSWNTRDELSGLNCLANSPPPVHEMGAFITSEGGGDIGTKDHGFQGSKNLPFLDLLCANEMEESSDESDSSTDR